MSDHPWWRIGVRNLRRNTRRTVITALGLAFGYFAVVALTGLDNGIAGDLIDNGTGILTGQVQVHAPDYLPDRRVYATIGGDSGTALAPLLRQVQADPGVVAAAPRVYAGGLLSTGASTAAAMLLGIDPAREPRVARLAASLTVGRLPRAGERGLAIGTELARRIHAAVGDTIVVVAPAADGSLGNDLFVVTGLFASGLADLDAVFAIVPITSLQALINLSPDRVHEIAVRVARPWDAPAVASRLQRRLERGGTSVHAEAWTTFSPELVDYWHLYRASNWIVLVIVFGMAIFGVANTMLMATFERRREFALLFALGAVPSGIVKSVFVEALALGVLSLLVGAAMAVPVLLWWHNAPPDLSHLFGSITMGGALLPPRLHADSPGWMAAAAAAALLLTALLASVLPAVRAARVPPAETLAGR